MRQLFQKKGLSIGGAHSAGRFRHSHLQSRIPPDFQATPVSGGGADRYAKGRRGVARARGLSGCAGRCVQGRVPRLYQSVAHVGKGALPRRERPVADDQATGEGNLLRGRGWRKLAHRSWRGVPRCWRCSPMGSICARRRCGLGLSASKINERMQKLTNKSQF